MEEEKIQKLAQLIEIAEINLESAKALLQEINGGEIKKHISKISIPKNLNIDKTARVIEGVFDGEMMIGGDGHTYPVPPNYASKSRLVAGDILKLSISEDGSFIYKQIAPVKRKKLIGILQLEDGKYKVVAEGKLYNVLTASVTYYKAEPGDQVTILIPEENPTEWATIENVLHS